MAGQAARKKAPQPADRLIGSRIRMRRRTLNISQTWLGNAIGVTFQQIQKYENGTNRVGAGRLQQIADALQCDVAWFFEGKGKSAARGSTAAPLIDADLSAFYAERYAPRVVRDFARLAPPVKRAIAIVVAAAAGRTDES
jgi:transcriptional regulator with XRE-family HTH domain